MSIKVKLIVSYLAMLLIPIVLSVLSIYGIGIFSFNKLQHAYNLESVSHPRGRNPFEEIQRIQMKILSDIKATTISGSDKMENINYLDDLNKKLSKFNSYIIVRKNDKIIYADKFLDKDAIGKELPRFGAHTSNNKDDILIKKQSLVVNQEDFYFSDKAPGSTFIVTNVAIGITIIKQFFIMCGFAVVLILIATNGVLTYLMSRSILIPLEELKKATFYIKEGNLDFQVKQSSKDELGDLCIAFEEMRSRLKDSVENQFKYENDRKELISNISHDLKTPITSIKGYVEGIRDGVADSPIKMEKYINTIYNKASDMDKLIDELFLFSKLDLKKITFDFEKIDIHKYLKDSAEELQFDLEKKGITLTLDFNKDTPVMVMGDREKLKRVITNVIGNAVKYIHKEKGSIKIFVIEEQTHVVIRIEDNGIGIPKEALPSIFQRFYRADPSRNLATGGSGLGLAIVKRIIEEHGGAVWAQSEENRGTAIFFTLKKLE